MTETVEVRKTQSQGEKGKLGDRRGRSIKTDEEGETGRFGEIKKGKRQKTDTDQRREETAGKQWREWKGKMESK